MSRRLAVLRDELFRLHPLLSYLLVIEDTAKIGYPPARVWGVPTTMLWAHRIGLEKAKRLMFTGDCLSGAS